MLTDVMLLNLINT